jgi:hypothetical protein
LAPEEPTNHVKARHFFFGVPLAAPAGAPGASCAARRGPRSRERRNRGPLSMPTASGSGQRPEPRPGALLGRNPGQPRCASPGPPPQKTAFGLSVPPPSFGGPGSGRAATPPPCPGSFLICFFALLAYLPPSPFKGGGFLQNPGAFPLLAYPGPWTSARKAAGKP